MNHLKFEKSVNQFWMVHHLNFKTMYGLRHKPGAETIVVISDTEHENTFPKVFKRIPVRVIVH